MQAFIQAKREEIAELCRTHHVRRLSLFGSAARDDFDPSRSDVDIVVDFDEMPIERYFDNKEALHQRLTSTFSRPVDLLTWTSIRNRYLLREIQAAHIDLYAA